jgi:hypothetical protein
MAPARRVALGGGDHWFFPGSLRIALRTRLVRGRVAFRRRRYRAHRAEVVTLNFLCQAK